MSLEALLAVVTGVALSCLIFGVRGLLRPETSRIDWRLRHYSGHADELTEHEQKQAASVQVTQMLATRLEQSVSDRTFAAQLRSGLARANVHLSVGEFLILQ